MINDYTFDTIGTDIESHQFSGKMVIFLFLHVIFMVIDRVIYLKQNRSNLEYDYFIFDKETQQKMSDEDYETLKAHIIEQTPELQGKPFYIPIHFKEILEKKYNIATVQKEPPNYPLISKYVLNMIFVIISHLCLFFVFPFVGNFSAFSNYSCEAEEKGEVDIQYCNDFQKKWHLRVAFVIYALYMFLSCQQIKYGYKDIREKSYLKRGTSVISSSIHSVSMVVPFFYELKLAIDWAFTQTSLSLFQWNKFECIYGQLFVTLCSMKAVNVQPVGMKINLFKKVTMGGCVFFVIILALIGPLLLFSDLNPINMLNNVTNAYVRLDLCIMDKTSSKNYTIFQNNLPNQIKQIDSHIWNSYEYHKRQKTKEFDKSRVQVVEMNNISDQFWIAPEPTKDDIIKNLENVLNNETNIESIVIGFRYKFTRPIPADETPKSLKSFDMFLYQKDNIEKTHINLIEDLRDGLKNRKNTTLKFLRVFTPAVKLTANPHPKLISRDLDKYNVIVNYVYSNETKESYFGVGFERPDLGNIIGKLVFHTFSNKVPKTFSSYGVITFYTTFILVFGNMIKGIFAGEAMKVHLTEMPHPEHLVNLCEGILISRYSYELEKEEQLYYVLIEFMRSPEYLKMITETSLNQFNRRKNELKVSQD